ncbi:hypothetical protein IWQ62_003428 [Dispira parvispora]|uniref:Uncharacterized protein n=1 Tax=Dispira parvispora TaxID=1520584 RepID=A0A9W8AMX4_9FUNG|nr:hypothetical protein IWQ62_003428 [Dispira parvispora]
MPVESNVNVKPTANLARLSKNDLLQKAIDLQSDILDILEELERAKDECEALEGENRAVEEKLHKLLASHSYQ